MFQQGERNYSGPGIGNSDHIMSDNALILHIWHIDTVEEIRRHVDFFPDETDQFVTFSNDIDSAQRSYIERSFPHARLFPVKNIGQDFGALLQLRTMVDLSKYDFLCKIHSKKGLKEPEEWRKTLLQGVSSSSHHVGHIIEYFRNFPNILIAGSRHLYLYGPKNLFKNGPNIENLFGSILNDFDFRKEDWGFIAGSCFWFRRSILDAIAQCPIDFEEASYTDDGLSAHALERMFGMVATIMGGQILLSDTCGFSPRLAVETAFPHDLPREVVSIKQTLATLAIARSRARPRPLQGSLDLHPRAAVIRGWLAAPDDPCPRDVILRCENVEIRVIASVFRQDLKDNNINEGRHAFHVNVPRNLVDGSTHDIALIDAATGQLVTTRSCRWERPIRAYRNFDEFLRCSMIQPMIPVPFMDEDKRCFAVMENIADHLARQALALEQPPLVSVIMPIYNRADILGEAIQSILSQQYRNFELIIIDDGSEDDSVAVIRGIDDPRIRLIPLSRNGGQCKARNIGVTLSDGQIIAYLDSDNMWDDRYLAATVGAFVELPEADAIATGQFLFRGNDKKPFAARYGHLNKALVENNNYIDLNSLAHRRSLVADIGGLNEQLIRYVDFDFILRIMDKASLWTVPVLLTHYHFDRAENQVTRVHDRPNDMTLLRREFQDRMAARLAEQDLSDLHHPVSVIIPNWQSLEDINQCLDALCARDWKGQLEIIVVDNGSDQDVVDRLRQRRDAGQLRLIENNENYGFSYAVNQGIAIARADADILLLNNDAIVQPGSVQALQQAAFALADAGITVPRQILPPGTKTVQQHAPYANPAYAADVNLSAHHRNILRVDVYHDGGPVELHYAPFFAAYIRRPVIESIGPLDAEFGRHYRSDRAYCDLMRTFTGKKIYYVPDAHVIHKLQRATETLRADTAGNTAFDLMFHRNQWSAADRKRLGYRSAVWDIF